tara:strand:+ start:321 stop:665 length:345 start_codon:yes stop_codon:yes gene_type:complete
MNIPIVIKAPRLTKLMSLFIDVTAITLFPFIVFREEMNEVTLNHETIHIHQQKELFVLFFYMLYVFDWLKGLVRYKDTEKAYYQIRFEQEAYANMRDEGYLLSREKYAWRAYKV